MPSDQIFNCAQRAHANTLEFLPSILAMAGFLGCFHPELATAGVLTWVASKVAFTVRLVGSWERG